MTTASTSARSLVVPPANGRTQLEQKDVDRALAVNNLPPVRPRGIFDRTIGSVEFWFWVALTVICLAGGWYMWALLATDFPLRQDVAMDLDVDIIRQVAKLAALSAVPSALLFILIDRWRPQRAWAWVIALAWGAVVATPLSYELNTWLAGKLHVVGQLNPAAGARPAIFVAPFVEEATKATVLFWIAIAMRNRWVGVFSGVSLAGLSGVGFAFVENILYYARALVYATQTSGAVTPDEAVRQIVIARGLMSWFAHPLFTIMTGLGLVIAVRTRSKTVRIIAPLAGFSTAALLHMLFNGFASTLQLTPILITMLIFVVHPILILVAVIVFRELLGQRDLIRTRLTDYERAGWLSATEVDIMARPGQRLHVMWDALWTKRGMSGYRLVSSLTELAYLRDAMLRGLVDEGGRQRELFLLERARTARSRLQSRGLWRATAPAAAKPGERPLTAGASESSPRVSGFGGTQYSAVDPRWKPPSV